MLSGRTSSGDRADDRRQAGRLRSQYRQWTQLRLARRRALLSLLDVQIVVGRPGAPRSGAGRLNLAETLAFSRADIVAYSPVVEENLSKGSLPILALAEAVQITSDNAAANVLMRRLGGPDAVTRFWRGIGDQTSRLDGYEPAINVIPLGTEENSTTPRAMAETVRRIVLGDVLGTANRDLLRGWMAATQSGTKRIRASLPASWKGLDKTGTGMRPAVGNKTNDLAVLMPPGGRSPLIVTGYFENPSFSEDTRPADEAVLEMLGKVAVAWSA